jgi:RNA methyltransferase, TrmH family
LTIKHISSRENPAVRLAQAVKDGKEHGLIFVEGLRLSEEAFRAGASIHSVFFTDEFRSSERGRSLVEALGSTGVQLLEITLRILDFISDTKSPSGIVLLAQRPITTLLSFENIVSTQPLVLLLHRLNNPSNTGAILRTAEAAGVSAVITTEGTADLFSPKSLRASMGSAFRLPIIQKIPFDTAIELFRKNSLHMVGTSPTAAHRHTEVEWRRGTAIVLGPEATGLSADETSRLDQIVSIPMKPPVESLNVAVAAAILVYEAARQREFSISPDPEET